ncbi:MAG: RNA 3'-terminal phosphate cyclase [Candidatus ainarchaeum sp.]|nr:RNA 3'-terminal phosphate cyclase [Candidatus ainarchaeum sp.]
MGSRKVSAGMLEIDGSHGEGGGAVLRNAVALSAALGTPVRVSGIRAGRREPGLKMQHLTGVKALAEICSAEVEGLSLGSTEIVFAPGRLSAGGRALDVGTAGSLTLVLQSLLPALAFAPGETRLSMKGGTDVPFSPSADYFSRVLLPVLARMGFIGEAGVERRGWYPKGGGLVKARFRPAEGGLKPLRLVERGGLVRAEGVSVASNLAASVAERQAKAAEKELALAGTACAVKAAVSPALSPGSCVTLWAEFSSGAVLGASALGGKGKPAEEVGREAARGLASAIASGACVDRHLCDQLLPFAALAKGETEFASEGWTAHSETNAWLVGRFIKKAAATQKMEGGATRVTLQGTGLGSE